MIEFFVPGIPATAGSRRPMVSPKTGRAYHIKDCKREGPWRSDVQNAAMKAFNESPLSGPLVLHVRFVFPRPMNHYRSGKNSRILNPSRAPGHHMVKPDTTKLVRALEDALKGLVWVDDNQVVDQHACKRWGDRYCERPGAYVVIERVEEDGRLYVTLGRKEVSA